MHGLHLTADLRDCRCDPGLLQDAPALVRSCLDAVLASGLRAVDQLFHRFPDGPQGPGGVTATVLLAESHLCLHTWPELSGVTLDVYVCNLGADHGAQARALLARLLALFQAGRVERQELQRGLPAVESEGLCP
ncbi:MAG: S-adenosylmethionine decarboxylase [Curvibacter sp.]|nr:S-adenosylmethionine decarboxylase [Curvibacter sp.]